MEYIDKLAIENILKLIESRGITQKKLAEMAGLSAPALNRNLKFKSPFSRSNLKAIAQAMGVSVESLYVDKRPKADVDLPTHADVLKYINQLASENRDLRDQLAVLKLFPSEIQALAMFISDWRTIERLMLNQAKSHPEFALSPVANNK